MAWLGGKVVRPPLHEHTVPVEHIGQGVVSQFEGMTIPIGLVLTLLHDFYEISVDI